MGSSDTGSTCSVVFENAQHSSSILDMFSFMRTQGHLLDVVLQVGDKDIACHRAVLAATCPYFHAMFTTSLTEQHASHVSLQMDPHALELIIEYAYTGKVEINADNSQELMSAASFLDIPALLNACAEFMETQLDVQNCIGIYCYARALEVQPLKAHAKEYIERHFTSVCQEEEILTVTKEILTEFMMSAELNVEQEEIVLECLVHWIAHEPNMRLPLLNELLPCIRVGLVNPSYFEVQTNPPGSTQEICMSAAHNRYLSQACSGGSNASVGAKLAIDATPACNNKLRSGMIKPEVCLMFIGGCGQGSNLINCYNPLTRETYSIASFPSTFYYALSHVEVESPACCVTEVGQIYVAGGNYIVRERNVFPDDEDLYDGTESGESVHKDLFLYDSDHDRWVPKSPMLFPRSNFTMVSVGIRVFCFGGITVNRHATEMVEAYDTVQNRWNYVGMMPASQVDLSSVVHDGLIYLLGGRMGVSVHNMVQRYDSQLDQWTSMAGMPTPRFCFGACVVANEIWVAGGETYVHNSMTVHRETLRSVEIYSVPEDRWKQGPSLPEPLSNVSLFFVNGSLYACGTSQIQSFHMYHSNLVCRLDFHILQWEILEEELSDTLHYAALAAALHTRKLSQVFRPAVDT